MVCLFLICTKIARSLLAVSRHIYSKLCNYIALHLLDCIFFTNYKQTEDKRESKKYFYFRQLETTLQTLEDQASNLPQVPHEMISTILELKKDVLSTFHYPGKKISLFL